MTCEQSVVEIERVVDEGTTVSPELAAHLSTCRLCAEELNRIQEEVQLLRDYVSSESGTAELWTRIAAEITPVRKLPVPERTWWLHPSLLRPAAAGLALVFLLGAIVYFKLSEPVSEVQVTKETAAAKDPGAQAVLAAEQEYLAALRQLQETFEAERAEVDPVVAGHIDHTTKELDSIIREARSAWLRDPQDPIAAHWLLTAYDRKRELLQYVVAL